MFSKELESLIQATLEDGILEDNEKAALVKRAQNEGVDLDELEIYINSILQKRKRELNEKKESEYSQIEKEKKAALGKVCPKCGRQVPPLTLVCECGYEFTSARQVSSVNKLFDSIEEIQSAPMKSRNTSSEEYKEEKKNRNKQIRNLINLFPVPNTKEDIIEFLSLAFPNAQTKGGQYGTLKGRLKLVSIVVIVLTVILYLLMPEYYETTEANGFNIFDLRTVEKETPKTLISVIFAVVVFVAGIFFSKSFDTEVLEWNENAMIWRAKFEQVLMKGRSLRADAEFTRMLDYYEHQLNGK